MKILIIHNNYQFQGGEYIAVEMQKSLLLSRGQQVSLYLRDNAEINGYNFQKKIAFFPETIYSRASQKDIIKLVRVEKPDVAHVHNVFPLISPSVYYALRDLNIPIVQTVHNFRFLCPNGLFYTHNNICERCKFGNTLNAVRLKCYKNSYMLSSLYAITINLHRQLKSFDKIDHFIALTEFSAHKLIESKLTTREKVSVLGHFIDTDFPLDKFSVIRKPYIVYVGRLSKEKGVHILIKAIKKIPELSLKVLGDGPQREELMELVNREGITNVNFLGVVKGSDKFEIVSRALASVAPSLCYENFPLATIESLRVGTPVIASRLGSLPYIVRDGENGFLFEPGNVVELAGILHQLYSSKEMVGYLGENGQKIVQENFSAQIHYQRLISIYNGVGH